MDVRIIRSKRRTAVIEVKNGEVLLRVPLLLSSKKCDGLLKNKDAWIKKALERDLERRKNFGTVAPFFEPELKELKYNCLNDMTARVRHYAPLVGVGYNKISIRFQLTRWGSCSSKGNLNFNGLLFLCPEIVRNTVAVHELCHRKQMNHSKYFYGEMERVLPEYKEGEKWLKLHGATLLERLAK